MVVIKTWKQFSERLKIPSAALSVPSVSTELVRWRQVKLCCGAFEGEHSAITENVERSLKSGKDFIAIVSTVSLT